MNLSLVYDSYTDEVSHKQLWCDLLQSNFSRSTKHAIHIKQQQTCQNVFLYASVLVLVCHFVCYPVSLRMLEKMLNGRFPQQSSSDVPVTIFQLWTYLETNEVTDVDKHVSELAKEGIGYMTLLRLNSTWFCNTHTTGHAGWCELMLCSSLCLIAWLASCAAVTRSSTLMQLVEQFEQRFTVVARLSPLFFTLRGLMLIFF